ncbi:MAG TPA: hypothetical protein VMA55_11250 [Acidovorax sp.]|nr:hypothetical protein [Acidovorax sp.]
MSNWPFPAAQPARQPQRDQVLSVQAEYVLKNQHTPEQLEAAMKAQGDLVEWHTSFGRREPAREAAKVVKQLNLMRTPEAVAAMERSRGLA